MTLFTGKHAATHDGRDLLFHDYVDSDVINLNAPPPSKQVGHAALMPTPRLMLGNGPDNSVHPGYEGAGDCVLACFTNYLRLAYAITGKGLFPATGLTAIQNYSEVTGYVIDDASTDQGTNMRTAMNWWRKTGYKDAQGARHKIGAWAKVKVDLNHLLWAAYLVDMGVPLGIMFPDFAMQQFDDHQEWKPVAGAPAPNEGHAILLDRRLYVESWARDQETDAAGKFLLQYTDEAYFVIDAEGTVNGKTLEGVDTRQLLSDAKQFS